MVAGDGAILAAPVVHDELQVHALRGLFHRRHGFELAVHPDLGNHDHVRALIDPETHFARGVSEAM
jgi:hypothetical protein